MSKHHKVTSKLGKKFSSTRAPLTATLSWERGSFLMNDCQNFYLPQAVLLHTQKKNKNKQVPSQELNAKWLHVYLSTAKIATYLFT